MEAVQEAVQEAVKEAAPAPAPAPAALKKSSSMRTSAEPQVGACASWSACDRMFALSDATFVCCLFCLTISCAFLAIHAMLLQVVEGTLAPADKGAWNAIQGMKGALLGSGFKCLNGRQDDTPLL